jgi:hypothetical protein
MIRNPLARLYHAIPFAITLAAGLISAASAQTHLSFTIADSLTGHPIAGALVELRSPNGSPLWSGRSGPDGRVVAPTMPGLVVVTANMLAYGTAGPVTITIPERDSAFVRILLRRRPSP